MSLSDEQYVLFTTFRRDGRAVATPVWLAELPGGEFGFTTGGGSGKAKRLRHTARVTLQGCDRQGGDAHGPVYDGEARLVSGAELQPVRSAITKKYGLLARVLGLVQTVARTLGLKRFGSESVGVVIRLSE